MVTEFRDRPDVPPDNVNNNIHLIREYDSRGKLPPHDDEAERSMIGTIILPGSEAVPQIRTILPDPRDCYRATHWYILAAAYAVQDAGEPVDPVTLGSELERRGWLDEVGGDAGLRAFALSAVTDANAAHYATKVRDAAFKRHLWQHAADLAAMTDDTLIPPQNILDVAEAYLADERKKLLSVDARPRFHSMTLAEARKLPKPIPLLGQILWKESIHVLYGESSTWKSKVALSMALCIATGTAWLGSPVAQGPVLYIAAEGGSLVTWDALVWLNAHGFYGADIDAVPFRILTRPPDLCKSGEMREFINTAIDEFMADYEAAPVLIVDDTLSTSMTGSENDAVIINSVYRSLRMAQHDMGNSALVVHHTGKDPTREERGNYAIRANADATMVIDTGNVAGGDLEPGMPISLVNKKPYKSAPKFAPVHLTTKLHTLIEDSGEQYTSLVVIPADHAPAPKVCRAGQTKAGTTMNDLMSIARNGPQEGMSNADLKRAFMAKTGLSAPTFDRKLGLLAQAGNLINIGGLWRPSDDA